jgi:hypothetical protein
MPVPFHVPHDLLRVPLRALMVLLLAAAVVSVPQASAAARLSPCYSSDNGDPDLTSLTLSSSVVDVTATPVRVTITATVLDSGGPGPASGMRSVVAYLNRAGRQYAVPLREAAGVWSGTQKMRPGVRAGEYVVAVSLVDRANNSAWYQGETLAELGAPTTITVLSDPDLRPPQLRMIRFRHRPLDITEGPRWQVLTVRVTDHRSGVASVNVSVDRLGILYLHRLPDHPNLFRARLKVRAGMAGKIYLSGVRAYDVAGNQGSWDELDKTSFAPDYSFMVLGPSDLRAPATSPLTASHRYLDVRRGPRTLGFEVTATDSASGVATVELTVLRDRRWVNSISLRRTAGTVRDGLWSRQLLINGCTWDAGRYRFVVRTLDAAGNFQIGGSTAVAIQARETRRPRAEILDRSLASGEPLHVLFNEAVRGVDTMNAMVTSSADGSQVAGSWICRGMFTDDVSCLTGSVRSATFTPTDPLTPGASYQVEFNPEHRLGVMDRHGNPFDRARGFFDATAP